MKIKIIIGIILLLLICVVGVNLIPHNNGGNSSNWSYSKDEYPLDEYHLDQLPVSHKSTVEVKQFFEDSDTNNDGVLKGDEISNFDYKIKHSQYTFNGPYGYN
ncbi:MAG TPA: hypothetical protein HA277_01515 [Methanosphaera sp.]|nr:hypothetical protein [Methanosphaera sp.]HII09331.1 hypothetical protein [Methanosphaera sp.]HIJ15064.1 hypothetical protein [Methanosphaera sp.]